MADAKPNMALADEISPKKAKKAEKQTTPKQEKPSARQQAIESWEDNDDGVAPHVPFGKLSKEAQQDWIAATAPDDGAKPYNTAALHDEIVEREGRNARTERSNAKAAESRKGKEEADGIDLRRADRPSRDFAYVQLKTINDLQRAAQRQLDSEGRGETIQLSAVPVGDALKKLPGIGVIERAAKLFGKKVKYFRVVDGPAFFDGAVIPGSDTIFVNINSTYPHLRIFGHELVHAIRNAHPQTYNRLTTFLMPMLDEAGMAEFARKQNKEGITDQAAILEEAIGDIVGDRIGEQEFWKLMAEENPTLFRQVAEIVTEFVNRLLEQISGTKSLGSDTLVKDLVAVRSSVATVLRDLGDMVQQEQAGPDAAPTTTEAAPKFKRTEDGQVTPFYSALEKALTESKISLDKSGAASAEQWRSWLGKKDKDGNYVPNISGVKAEEVEWVGIDKWLEDLGKQKITKQQVVDWFNGNRIHVNDYVLSENPELSTTTVDGDPIPQEVRSPTIDDLREFVERQIGDQENDWLIEQERLVEEGVISEVDFFDESRPGHLDVLPSEMSTDELKDWIRDHGGGYQNYERDFRRQQERAIAAALDRGRKAKHGGGNLVLPGGKEYRELVMFDPSAAEYKSYDEAHYGTLTRGRSLAWLRMNERKDASGNHVLFIEEVQSQRGQDAEKQGFVGQKTADKARLKTLRAEIKEKIAEAKATAKTASEDTVAKQYEALKKLQKTFRRIKKRVERDEYNVPIGPFVGSTQGWVQLGVKRAIAYAQERGIDRIAWTTGEQQNQRYRLSSVVDQIHVLRNPDMPKEVVLIGVKNGQHVFTRDVEENSLEELLGEELGESVRKGRSGRLANANEFGFLSQQDRVGLGVDVKGNKFEDGTVARTYDTPDLDVGGEGMRSFYDRILPQEVNKIIKKYGGQTEVMQIDGTGQQLGFVVPEKLQQIVETDGLPMFRRRDYEAQFDDLPPDVQQMAVAKGHYSPPTIRERLDGLKSKMWLRVVQGTFDRFRSVRDISLKAYMQLRMSTTVDGALEGLLHFGQVFNDDGALNLKKGTKGLLEILGKVGPETDRFLLWIAANRAGELKKQDRERFFSEEEITKLKRLNAGTMKDGKSRVAVYAETLRQMNELNRSVLDVARQTGLIDDAAYKRFSADIWYIPFYRQMDDDATLSAAQTSSASVGQYLSKKLKGSERQLNDLMENVLLNWSHILSASMKNQAANTTLDSATQLGGVVTKLERQEKGAVKTMVNGKETFWRIDDEFLLASLDSVANVPSYGFFTNLAREFKTMLTRFIALNPSFKINNLIRDSIQSIGLTELDKNPIANVIQGIRAYKNERAEALIGGGLFAMGNAFDGDRAASVKRLIKAGVPNQDIWSTDEKIKNGLKKLRDKYSEVSDALENANRLALYQQLRSKGASHLEAAYAARDLQDFSLQGNFIAIRYLSQVLPYFNARLQGMYKLGRDGLDPSIAAIMGNANESQRQKAAKFGVVLGAVTMAGLVLYLSQADDEDWKKREDWDRDMFFWFKIPGTDTAIRIPKPFEMGAFATIIERLTEQIVDKDVEGKVFGKRLLAVLSDNLAINMIPQVVRPLYDIARNKDGFNDRPIESMAAERLSPENRVNAGTSAAGVALGTVNAMFADFVSAATGGAVNANNLKASPIQYDYLLRGYLGWLGTFIQTTSNAVAAPFKEGESPDMRVDQIFVIGNYVKSLPQNQSKYVTNFYENAKEVATATADFKSFIAAGNIEKAQAVAEEKRDLIGLNKMYSHVQDKMSTISKQIKRVQDDKEMPGDQKRLEIDRLSQLRIEYAKLAEDARIARKKEE